jgi:outer membrane protein OmpA-like peptidoglycan-associated protein
MSKKTMYLLGILLTILIGTYFYWKHCCGDTVASNDIEEVVQEEVVETNDNLNIDNSEDATEVEVASNTNTAGFPFLLEDANGDFSFRSNDNFNFNPNGYAINLPIAAQIDEGIGNLNAYFEENKRKRLHITGLYTSAEENTSAYPNLGMARANSVKNYLKEKGMKGRFMEIFGQLDDQLALDGTMYKGPMRYAIISKNAEKDDETELAALRAKIQADPLILNFANAQTSINLTEAQRQKVADIARYLDKAEGAMAMVTGHTDNTGSRAGNVNISLKRANFAKNYLVQNGIAAAQIQTAGKGPDEPIASNDTEAGKAQNRRTVVTLN